MLDYEEESSHKGIRWAMDKRRLVIWLTVFIASWYGMMLMHELGHCLGALVCGADIDAVVIPLFGFSRTDVSGGSSPLLVVWAGPIAGAILPLGMMVLVRRMGRCLQHAILFFCGFCLVANGAYVGIGSVSAAGDCRQMLHLGSPVWLLVVFGVIAAAAGLYAWHRMGAVSSWFDGKQIADWEGEADQKI